MRFNGCELNSHLHQHTHTHKRLAPRYSPSYRCSPTHTILSHCAHSTAPSSKGLIQIKSVNIFTRTRMFTHARKAGDCYKSPIGGRRKSDLQVFYKPQSAEIDSAVVTFAIQIYLGMFGIVEPYVT
ncbi:hypothetical protein CROQUDRAFT_177586 [Cronartium quercuum f. sp. fusiforme G11]|uniref:Uncharacterized protein n=1 Tax=Cronartium quercuum f. sp. fusiforme G11 TaxID=708437 RepID=A0A9P6NRA6_9BASI|nr:hypothetical protein CROQUDRAFT_177586 [Cronartium quercuum f. sp. fusiforme G11]